MLIYENVLTRVFFSLALAVVIDEDDDDSGDD